MPSYNWEMTDKHRKRATESLRKTMAQRPKKISKPKPVFCQRCGRKSTKPYKRTLTVNTNIQINVCKDCHEKHTN